MEAEFVEWLQSRVPPASGVPVGIGDDAAIVTMPDGQPCVVTSDMLMDGVDFRIGECEAERVGRKALAVNLSDIAAMAARPTAAIVSVAFSNSQDDSFAKAFYEGLLDLADEFQVPVVGGDTNRWNGPFVVSVTLMGALGRAGPLLRSGGRSGDAILVTGDFGGSILGKHFDFRPRIEEAIKLHDRGVLHAGMDVSDGLSLDLSRLAASSGCGAELDLSRIPISAAAQRFAETTSAVSSIEHALSDGEDFELILIVPSAEADKLIAEQPLEIRLTKIGRLIPELGLWQLGSSGERKSLEPGGYLH